MNLKMRKIDLPYGHASFTLNLPGGEILDVVAANPVSLPQTTPTQAVAQALAAPIGSPGIAGVVSPGDQICLIVPDATRMWQSPSVSVPLVVAELNKAGVKDADITILCACGTHRRMTPQEHEKLCGPDIATRIRIIDHQCGEMTEMRHLGTTSRGTPVYFNRHAVDADKIITVCGVVYHFLAGFGGGGKMLLPGIAANETVQANHKHALNNGMGSGMNPGVRPGEISGKNPFHADILEAAEMLPPAFSLNVVVNDRQEIIKAFAGDWKKAHLEACGLVGEMDGVRITRQADLTIASAGGAPKDINIYQAVKLLSNAMAATRPGGTIILLAECPEGFGNADCEHQIRDLKSMEEREAELRGRFSIGAFAGYLCAESAQKFRIILVTEMDAKLFSATGIMVVNTLETALDLAARLNGGHLPPAIVMPHGATTLPII